MNELTAVEKVDLMLSRIWLWLNLWLFDKARSQCIGRGQRINFKLEWDIEEDDALLGH